MPQEEDGSEWSHMSDDDDTGFAPSGCCEPDIQEDDYANVEQLKRWSEKEVVSEKEWGARQMERVSMVCTKSDTTIS